MFLLVAVMVVVLLIFQHSSMFFFFVDFKSLAQKPWYSFNKSSRVCVWTVHIHVSLYLYIYRQIWHKTMSVCVCRVSCVRPHAMITVRKCMWVIDTVIYTLSHHRTMIFIERCASQVVFHPKLSRDLQLFINIISSKTMLIHNDNHILVVFTEVKNTTRNIPQLSCQCIQHQIDAISGVGAASE